MRKALITLVAGVLMLSACQHSLTSYVNPFVGTDGHGHTFPGAILPFGMVQVSPDTRLDGWDGCSGYHYSDDTIYGFSHTHLSGTGCSDYGDLLIMPFTSENGDLPDSLDYSFYLSTFSHRNEKAEPGYYRVVLDRNRVMAEMTVRERTAMHKYTFPNHGTKGIVIDLKHRDVVIDSWIRLYDENTEDQALETSDNTNHKIITGGRISSAWNPEQHFYFAINTDCPYEIVYYKNGKAVDSHEVEGEDCKAVLIFPKEVSEVVLTVAISAVDEHGALVNLFNDEPVSFGQAKKDASATWEKALSQFEVEGGSREDRANFYTALYHCMTSPYLYSDADGRYRAMRNGEQRTENVEATSPESTNLQIYKSENQQIYTVFSVWDTYRALHPLLNITDPKRSRDFVLTMLDHYRHSGELTMWELSGHETHCMIGYNAASVILDAMQTGVLDDLDLSTLNELLEAMVATSNLPMLGRTEYARDGFLSSEYENESVSKTLEYAYDDWCIAQMAYLVAIRAHQLDPTDDFSRWHEIIDEYSRRCQSWKNIMDSDGFMHPRRNGAFVTPFDPTEVNNHFTEANSWQYSTYVPHDIGGWIAHIGGNDKAEFFLDSLFYGSSVMTGRDQSDITGLIGQYAHGNEPSHHAAYLYAFLGRQWKTAELVHQICKTLYHNSPDGLCGNEDCGQMSAWYVMSAMGFYPVCPGTGQYVVGSPLFRKVTIHLQNGKDIIINTNGKGYYINSLKINNINHNSPFIDFEQLKDGDTLDFEMASRPNTDWGKDFELNPFTHKTITPVPVFSDWQQSFDGETVVEIKTAHPKIQKSDNPTELDSIFYTLDGTTPTKYSTLYDNPFTISSDAVIKAVTYNPETGYSAVVTQLLTRTQNDRTLTYITQPAPQYCENGPTGLIDRLHGTENYRIGGWQGWQGDCEVIVDLLEPRNVEYIDVECLENMRSWIFFPTRITAETSNDKTSWQPFGSIDNTMFAATLDRQELSTVHNFTVNGTPINARYVRIKAINYGKLPKWHISAGEQAWLFVDEIEVK